jgi:hypothetical protein
MDMPKNILQVLLRKGDPNALSGKLIVYARVTETPESDSPWKELVRGGVVAVMGEYRETHSMLDFLKRELGGSLGDNLEEGLRDLRERNSEQWESLQELLKDANKPGRMEVIPIPAKVVFFDSEKDLLAQKADIFFLGEYRQIGNAHLAVSSFPILYQAAFREQELDQLDEEIENLLLESGMTSSTNQSELEEIKTIHYASFLGNLKDLLFHKILPELIHRAENLHEFEEGWQSFMRFMSTYPNPNDLAFIKQHVLDIAAGKPGHVIAVELLCRKIAALKENRFDELRIIQMALEQLDTKPEHDA